MKKKYTIKQILTSNGNWWRFYEANKAKIRAGILTGIVKLLSCRTIVRGYHQYRCENPDCPHIKRIAHSCKGKGCSSCGKKATELWIEKQNGILPDTEWQHITFTMPDVFWDFFWLNRHLLNEVGKIAADAVLSIAKTKGVIPAIFIAIHTFGRDLKRNVHIHLSTTRGGITFDLSEWNKLYFDETSLMKIWRYKIIKMLRKHHKNNTLIIPASIKKNLNPIHTFTTFLDQQYKRRWIVDCSKATENYHHTVNYLGRYVKRPPIAESKLRHYDGNNVSFTYRDHKSKSYRNFTTSVDEFITRFIQHIPDVGFRMIRYYGALANKVRGKLLPIIYTLLGQEKSRAESIQKITFASLMKATFNIDPLQCILCGKKLLLELVIYGKSSARDLIPFHRELALLKKI
ncbi:MAG TPA: IS91 family transposase [Gammaproteobacteria bacterium]|nr:IS91 family transposase [Gammaproteobacteria bacterium]